MTKLLEEVDPDEIESLVGQAEQASAHVAIKFEKMFAEANLMS